MKVTLNEELLCHMLDASIDSRVKELELKFAAWDEFQELTKVKNKLLDVLEEQTPGKVTEILSQYDDTYGLLVIKASEYFYEQGFADCMRIFGGVLEKKLQE